MQAIQTKFLILGVMVSFCLAASVATKSSKNQQEDDAEFAAIVQDPEVCSLPILFYVFNYETFAQLFKICMWKLNWTVRSRFRRRERRDGSSQLPICQTNHGSSSKQRKPTRSN